MISNQNDTHGGIWRNTFNAEIPFSDFKYSGRIWPIEKLISFWEYPTDRKLFIKIMNLLENELKIDINKFKIEIIHNENYVVFSREETSKSTDKYNINYWSSLSSIKNYIEKYTS